VPARAVDAVYRVHAVMLAPRSAAGTFVVAVVEFGEIANMDKRALSWGR
jgi:hypothetical protein